MPSGTKCGVYLKPPPPSAKGHLLKLETAGSGFDKYHRLSAHLLLQAVALVAFPSLKLAKGVVGL